MVEKEEIKIIILETSSVKKLVECINTYYFIDLLL